MITVKDRNDKEVFINENDISYVMTSNDYRNDYSHIVTMNTGIKLYVYLYESDLKKMRG